MVRRRVGNLLIVLGVAALGYAALWQFGIAPGSRVTLPPPVAIQHPPTAVPSPPAAPTIVPTVEPTPTAVVRASVPVPLIAPDQSERREDAHLPPPGYAVRLAIPAIKLETVVKQGGIVQDADGNPIWQTLPFVAVHYGDLTALVGARGNAVIAGHVVTLSEGNVFRFLYQLDLDDQIQVWDQRDVEHDFHVVEVKLVAPDDTSVMQPTPDPTLTLITCGGTFDPQKREFSDRLIVIAKPS